MLLYEMYWNWNISMASQCRYLQWLKQGFCNSPMLQPAALSNPSRQTLVQSMITIYVNPLFLYILFILFSPAYIENGLPSWTSPPLPPLCPRQSASFDPGSSNALAVVIHRAVLTWEQRQGVPLPFPVSHQSGPKFCLDMPFPAPFSPETPSSCLQKNHSSFKSCTSRELWKDAAISFVVDSMNMY